MPERYIKSYEIQNVACLRDVKGSLTPLHAFIGPNDSGKSTLLRALRTGQFLTTGRFEAHEESKKTVMVPFNPGILKGGVIALRFAGSEIGFQITVDDRGRIREAGGIDPRRVTQALRKVMATGDARVEWPLEFAEWLRSGARFVHFLPNVLREPSGLIPEGMPQTLVDEYGRGLPGIYDLLFGRGDDSVQRIMTDVRRLFPTVKSLRLKNVSKGEKAIEVELTAGEKVPAAFLSEGLLFYLAFAALQHLDPVALLLVEEPENGLHPARIADVMRILREISQTTQVVLATHSPLVINEMKGDEVTLVTRDKEKGTQVRLLSETPNFAERSRVYALGELWLSYANGVDEAPLLREDAAG